MGYAGGLNSHVASICPISWTNKFILLLFVTTDSDDNPCVPSRGSFFSKKTRSWIFRTHHKENTTHNNEKTSNNILIPIPTIYPQNAWVEANTWLAGQQAGQIFQQKRAAGEPNLTPESQNRGNKNRHTQTEV